MKMINIRKRKKITNKNPNLNAQESVTYDSSKAIRKLIFIGIGVLVACVIGGILITQLIGWGVERVIASIPDYTEPNLHFGDFLGGAIGLTVGFVLDKMCIERINCIYAFRRFMSALCHEFDNIQKKGDDGESHIEIVREVKKGKNSEFIKEEVQFDDSGEVINKYLSKCKGVLNTVKELILDNIVTSAETMSLISNLSAGDFTNRLSDFLGGVHRLISEYNKLVAYVESKGINNISEEDLKKVLKERRNINVKIKYFKTDKKFHKFTVRKLNYEWR